VLFARNDRCRARHSTNRQLLCSSAPSSVQDSERRRRWIAKAQRPPCSRRLRR
jgi:hypothetical protein